MIEYAQVLDLLADSEHAVRPGPGKFEACHDLRVARGLYELSLDTTNLDDQLGSVDSGLFIAILGQFVIWQDPQGFFEYEAFDSFEAAKLSFLCNEPPDEDEDDAGETLFVDRELCDFPQGFIAPGQ